MLTDLKTVEVRTHPCSWSEECGYWSGCQMKCFELPKHSMVIVLCDGSGGDVL